MSVVSDLADAWAVVRGSTVKVRPGFSLDLSGTRVIGLDASSLGSLDGLLRGPAGRDGKDGRDGSNGRDGAPGITKTVVEFRQGPPGQRGDPGEDGKDGVAGRDGRDGKDGDPGIRGPAGEGAAGKDGADGGTTWYLGDSAPDNGLGKPGDFFLVRGTGDFYKKGDAAWKKEGSLRGPQGQGASGPFHAIGMGVQADNLQGGLTDQVLTKNSNSDFDYSWQDSTGGGGSALEVLDESSSLDTAVTSINFTGAAVTATNVGHAVTVDISAGATPGGADKEIQFNDGGSALGGIPGSYWDGLNLWLPTTEAGNIHLEAEEVADPLNTVYLDLDGPLSSIALYAQNDANTYASFTLDGAAGEVNLVSTSELNINGQPGTAGMAVVSNGANVAPQWTYPIAITSASQTVTAQADDTGLYLTLGSGFDLPVFINNDEGDAGQVLTSGGAGASPTWAAPAAPAAAGNDNDVQFNNSGVLGGSDTFQFNLDFGVIPTLRLGDETNSLGGVYTGPDGAAQAQDLYLRGGLSGGTSVGGTLYVEGGAPTSGAGGTLVVRGGAGVGSNKAGGALNLQGGARTGNGATGDVTLQSMGTAAGTAGVVTVKGGDSDSGTAGHVLIQAGTSTSGTDGHVTITAADYVAGTVTGGKASFDIDDSGLAHFRGGINNDSGLTISNGSGNAKLFSTSGYAFDVQEATGVVLVYATPTNHFFVKESGFGELHNSDNFIIYTGPGGSEQLLQLTKEGELVVNGDEGTAGQVLTSAGANAPFTWEDSSAPAGGGFWFNGSGAPDNGDHSDDDFYLDTDTGDVYLKVSGVWELQTAWTLS